MIPTKTLTTHKKHKWIYCYIRGRADKFNSYPFPVWIARRFCKICKWNEILVPNNCNFNQEAKWIEDNIIQVGNTIFIGAFKK